MKNLALMIISFLLAGNALASEEALTLYTIFKDAGFTESTTTAEVKPNTIFWQTFVELEKVPALSCYREAEKISCAIDRDNSRGLPIEFSGEVSQKIWRALEGKRPQSTLIFVDAIECRYVKDSSEFRGKKLPPLAARTSCLITTSQRI